MTAWVWSIALLVLISAVSGIWWLAQWTAGPRRFFRAGNADPERGRFPARARDALAPETVEETPDTDRFDAPVGERAAAVIEGERHGPSHLRTSIDAAARGLIDEKADGTGEAEEPEPPPWSVRTRGSRRPVRYPRGAARTGRPRRASGRQGTARPRETGVAPADEPAWGAVRPYARRPGDPRGYRD